MALLVEAGANVDATDKPGGTPLHWAAEQGHQACVSLLLEAGSELDAGALSTGLATWPTCVVATLAAAVPRLHMPPQLLTLYPRHTAALEDETHWDHATAVASEERRVANIAVLQGESRWRRRRPLALIREQRRAVRDAGMVHKEWEREQQEAAAGAAAAAAAKKRQRKGNEC